MNEPLLVALANESNGVSMPAARVAAHAPSVSQINRRIAEAALDRVGIDRPPISFDTLRARYAAASETDVK